MIESGIFHHIYHIGCAFNLHSIFINGLVPGGQNLSRRQTVFFLPVDPRNESHRDPEYIVFSVPRLARYMHSAWKRHQDTVFWIDIDLGIKEGLVFYQTRSNAIPLVQLRSCFKEIFGGGRGEKYCLSYNFSPVFNLSTFTIQWDGSVP